MTEKLKCGGGALHQGDVNRNPDSGFGYLRVKVRLAAGLTLVDTCRTLNGLIPAEGSAARLQLSRSGPEYLRNVPAGKQTIMGSLKKRRKAKINKHKRRKKLRAHRHKKRTWQK